MTARPILFSGPMVRALLAGAKTQTRRVVTAKNVSFGHIPCPYGAPGDRLWVRETFRIEGGARPEHGPNGVHFRADEDEPGIGWRPSIFMPRWASRLTLEVTEVRVERLGALTYDDAQAEGVDFFPLAPGCSLVQRFALGWDAINGKRGFPWASNPWVWVVAFRRVAA